MVVTALDWLLFVSRGGLIISGAESSGCITRLSPWGCFLVYGCMSVKHTAAQKIDGKRSQPSWPATLTCCKHSTVTPDPPTLSADSGPRLAHNMPYNYFTNNDTRGISGSSMNWPVLGSTAMWEGVGWINLAGVWMLSSSGLLWTWYWTKDLKFSRRWLGR
jgi:hypothetical protein